MRYGQKAPRSKGSESDRMIKPDVIIAWPDSVDYPLFRQFLREERARFNQINIVFTKTHQGFNYSEFVKESMFADWCLFMENRPVSGEQDWRNVAIHTALQHSLHAEWILFLEQDFFPQPGFWEEVERLLNEGHEVIGVYDGTRLHPCFLLVRRTVLKQTTEFFGANPPLYDHFGKFQKDLEYLNIKPAAVDPKFWYHMNGLSHNFRLVSDGGQPNYKPDEFNQYAHRCKMVRKVPVHEVFIGILDRYLTTNA